MPPHDYCSLQNAHRLPDRILTLESAYGFLGVLCESLEKACNKTEELFDLEAGKRHAACYQAAIGSSINLIPESSPVNEPNAGFPYTSNFQTRNDISTDRQSVQSPGSSVCYRPALGLVRCGLVEDWCGRMRVCIWTFIFRCWRAVGVSAWLER